MTKIKDENLKDQVASTETKNKSSKVDFENSDTVIVTGVEDKKFSMSPDQNYEVTGVMAKILIEKGAAKFVKIKK